MATLNELRDEALLIAVEHGFTDASVPEDLALMHSELSEALEDHRRGMKPDEVWYEDRVGNRSAVKCEGSPLKPVGIPSEMADVIIRVLHFAGKHSIDIEAAVLEKMEFNRSRPFKHGKVL